MLKLRQDLITVRDDGKGKRQSWESVVSLDDAGINFCLYAYGESEEEARSNLEAKFQELLRTVSARPD